MLYDLLNRLSNFYSFFQIFHYITVRSACALLLSLALSLIIIPIIIKVQLNNHLSQPIRELGPETHMKKKGTPTMGGIAILISIIFSVLLWSNLSNVYVWLVLLVTIVFGALGFVDDYLKIKKQNSAGIRGKMKLFVQVSLAFIVTYVVYNISPSEFKSILTFPFFKNAILDLGIFYFIFASIVIVGASNAVNLTDGLDGLVTIPVALVGGCFAVIVYLVGSSKFAHYLYIIHIPDSAELAIYCASLVGACLGFLWFNAPPAEIFMGDTGSLALGGALGTISIITKHEILLAITGGIFVIEAISVIIQVYYFKATNGKRFFKMAPIHHHFEKCGWSETKVVVRFWIISIIFAIIGLFSLKVR